MNENSLLLEKMKSGDKNAEEELVIGNMRLVKSIAGRFVGRGCDIEDLIQIGAIGLIKAIHKFDTSFNVQFSTYAVPVIAGEIKKFLRDDGIIKVSRILKENAMRAKKCREILCSKLGREPTIDEISKESGIEAEQIMEAFDAVLPVESITVSDSDGNENEISVKSEEKQEETIVDKIFIEDMLKSLDARERQILVLRYFKGKTQAEVAKIIGVSQVQISRIEKSSVEKLKKTYSLF